MRRATVTARVPTATVRGLWFAAGSLRASWEDRLRAVLGAWETTPEADRPTTTSTRTSGPRLVRLHFVVDADTAARLARVGHPQQSNSIRLVLAVQAWLDMEAA